MIKNIVVEVEQRAVSGKNQCRRLRTAGQVPAVLYGLGQAAVSLAVSPRRIEEVLKLESGRNTIFTLSLGGDESQQRAVMIREIQRDPLTERMLHLDFIRVDLKKKIEVNVPVRLIGTPEGVKNEGGVVDFIHRTIEVQCLPGNIPEHLDVDISALHINQHVAVEDIVTTDDVEILESPETIIAVVSPPRAEEVTEAEAEAAEEAAAAEGEEPEVIKKGKEAEGEDAAEAKPKGD